MASENNKPSVENQYKRPRSHRILAWVMIVLLLSLYLITLIVAIIQNGEGTGVSGLFMACIGATIVLPGVFWIYMRLWQHSIERTREKAGFYEDADGVSGTGSGIKANAGRKVGEGNKDEKNETLQGNEGDKSLQRDEADEEN